MVWTPSAGLPSSSASHLAHARIQKPVLRFPAVTVRMHRAQLRLGDIGVVVAQAVIVDLHAVALELLEERLDLRNLRLTEEIGNDAITVVDKLLFLFGSNQRRERLHDF